MTDNRPIYDRHGPFAYFCVVAIGVLCAFSPGSISYAIGAIATIYTFRAVERGYRRGEEVKAGKA